MTGINTSNVMGSLMWGDVGAQKGKTQQSNMDFYVAQNPPPQKGEWAGFAGIQNMGGGRSVSTSVFKAENFSAQNPVFIVTGTDVDGTNFKVAVNINDVNPRNASLIEMAALNAYRSVNGLPRIPTVIFDGHNPEAGLDLARVSSASEQADFLAPLLELATMQRDNKNWESYFLLKEMTDWLLQFPRA